jgi:hypothetical protein
MIKLIKEIFGIKPNIKIAQVWVYKNNDILSNPFDDEKKYAIRSSLVLDIKNGYVFYIDLETRNVSIEKISDFKSLRNLKK